jgi:3-oxoacyl-[acyl-carrier protein] reductase
MRLSNKVAVITGGAAGIGFAYARRFLAEGARVVVADVADPVAAAGKLDAGGRVLGIRTDVSDIASVQAMVDAAVARFGRVDVLVNNAAVFAALKPQPFDQIPEAEWDRVMAVNVKGIWNCCKAVVPALRQAGGGSIVNIASLAATYGMPYALHYTTSKAAVIGLTRGLARELGRDNIRVNAVAPSAVLTEGTREFFAEKTEKALDTIKAGQALARTLNPTDLVGTVHWLVSDASRFVTGQTIAVDGGTVMH